MTSDVTIEGGARLTPHPLRAAVLGEVHARPFTPIETPRRILHFAFDTTGEAGRADRAALADFCARRGLDPLKPSPSSTASRSAAPRLRWEQHSEFTTYTWELPSQGATPFHPAAASLAAPMASLPQPGPLLVALDLHLLADGKTRSRIEQLFDRASLAVAENSEGDALFATDFQADPSGFVRILVLDRGLGPERAGALVQRIVELETYRTLALLGLPEAQRLMPSIGRIEKRLGEVTDEMRRTDKLIDNHRLLDELTELAAELEAGAAASLFRFGASRAYNEIVQMRLATIGERKVEGLPTWSSFLARRMSPAMRTCATTEERQGEPVGEAGARRQSVAHAGGRRNGAAEPRPAQVDERAHAAATAPADHGRRAVGRRGELLRGRAVRLSDEGPARRRRAGQHVAGDRSVRAGRGAGDLVGGAAHPAEAIRETNKRNSPDPRGAAMSIMYHDGNRQLQDRFDSRRMSDRLEEKLTRTAFTADDKAFIESAAYFFIATADAQGRPDCSFKGGMPGFVRVTGPSELAFPDYDGNGMFKSLGNMMVNPNIGLLFIAMHDKPKRLRVNGRRK